MRLTWSVLLTFFGALVLGLAIGWWAGSTQDDTWRSMRDHPDGPADCAVANAAAMHLGLVLLDCTTLPPRAQ